jgi:hypothetical protein
MNAAPIPRMILGHGFEEAIDFKDRDIMPEGCVLVALSDFGTPTVLSDSCKFQEAFADPGTRPYFEDPRKHKAWLSSLLGRSIRIYEPGMKYPKLSASLVNQFFFDLGEVRYGLSGVYDFPLPLEAITSGTEPCEVYYDTINISKIHKEIINPADIDRFLTNAYGKSPFPTKETVQVIFDRNKKTRLSYQYDPAALDTQLTVPISEIMKIRGPGVYYHIICRAVKETPSMITFEDLASKTVEMLKDAFDYELVENSATGEWTLPRAKKYEVFLITDAKQHWQSYIDEFIKCLKEDIEDLRARGYSDPILTNLLGKAEALQRKGRLIRVESQLQQIRANKAGGTRRRKNCLKRRSKTKRQNGRTH